MAVAKVETKVTLEQYPEHKDAFGKVLNIDDEVIFRDNSQDPIDKQRHMRKGIVVDFYERTARVELKTKGAKDHESRTTRYLVEVSKSC